MTQGSVGAVPGSGEQPPDQGDQGNSPPDQGDQGNSPPDQGDQGNSPQGGVIISGGIIAIQNLSHGGHH